MNLQLFYTTLTIFFVVGSLVEYWTTYKENKNYYSSKDFVSNVKLMLAGLAVDLVVKVIAVYFLSQLYEHSLFKLGYQWWSWTLCFIIWDFIFYWKHYLEHNIRFMWAIHVNHHSSTYMNLSTSLRSGVLKSTYRYFFWAIAIGIGFPVPMFLVLYGVGKIWAFFSHSQLLGKWGILESYFITPTHHLLHHSCNENNLNKNFGETLLVWDKLFRTFKQTKEPLTYGINEPVDHNNFSEVVFHELRQMIHDIKATPKLSEKLKIVFGKPGYKPLS